MTTHADPSDPNLPSLPSEHAYLDERRRATRFVREPGTDYATIVSPESLAGPIEVADESLGGIGVVVTDRNPFFTGQVLGIAYAGSSYQARVCHITKRRDGRFTVGLLCAVDGQSPSPTN
jgi:hypothetical protein